MSNGGLQAYTHGHAKAVVNHHAKRTAEAFACRTLPLLSGCSSVLDVGCGPGSITLGFAKYLPPRGRIVGVDLSPEALEMAREAYQEKIQGTEPSVNITFQEADIYKLPFADGEFDLVHAHQVLQHVNQPVQALREMARVSRKFVSVREVDFGSWRWAPREMGMDRWLDVYMKVCRSNGAEPCAGLHIKRWMREAEIASSSTVSAWTDTVSYTSPERTRELGATWAERVSATKLAEQMVHFGHCSRQETLEMAAAWKKWGEHEDALLYYTDVSVVAEKRQPSTGTKQAPTSGDAPEAKRRRAGDDAGGDH